MLLTSCLIAHAYSTAFFRNGTRIPVTPFIHPLPYVGSSSPSLLVCRGSSSFSDFSSSGVHLRTAEGYSDPYKCRISILGVFTVSIVYPINASLIQMLPRSVAVS